jgi:RNA polymerase sigma factor (sigma-70 family)
MTNAVLSAAVGRAGRVALECEPGPPATDDHLLTRFAGCRDESAFRELVRRHGPMVLGVCRRVTGHHEDAEDAFQAAFLVLARRAAAIRPGGAVRAWLYGVAVRVAREARAVSVRRRARESSVPDVPDCPAPVVEDDRDELAVLDEEIAGLPDHLRAAVVACEMDGLSRREGAIRLGIPEGTLSSRLAKARSVLAERLRDRGIMPPACVQAALAAVAVPAALVARTTAVVTHGAIPAAVATLAQRAGTSLLLLKLRSLVPAAVILAVVFVAAALSGAATPPVAPETIGRLVIEGPARIPVAAPAAKPRDGEILIWRKGHAALLKPDGTVVREWKGDDVPEPGAARLSPDGQTIAVLRPYETRAQKQSVDVGGGAKLPGTFSRHLFRVTLYPVADKLVGTDVLLPGDSAESLVWSADGAKLYAGTHADDPNYSHDNDLAHFVIDVTTRKHTPLKLPAGHHLKDVSPDGKTFLTIGPRPDPSKVRPAFLVSANGGEPIVVTALDEVLYDGRFSSDGRRLVMCGLRAARALPGPAGGNSGTRAPPIGTYDYWLELTTTDAPKRRTPLALADNQYVNQCRYSPDGNRVVSFRAIIPPLNQPALPREVVVSDADGRNAKTIFTDSERLAPVFVDWW